jgi:hypothetical protein
VDPHIVPGLNLLRRASSNTATWKFSRIASAHEHAKPAPAIQIASPAASHHASWRAPLVTEATKSLSQAVGLACIGRARLSVAESGSRVSEKRCKPSKILLHLPPCTASTERCLRLHCKQRCISQPRWDRILLSRQRPHPDPTPAALHNREPTPTTIKLRQTRRLHQHVGHPGDPAAMAQPRVIIPNNHSIIHRLAAPRPRRR